MPFKNPGGFPERDTAGAAAAAAAVAVAAAVGIAGRYFPFLI